MDFDQLIAQIDTGLRTLHNVGYANRSYPPSLQPDMALSPKEDPAMSAQDIRHAAGLMRVNHVGEVCAQALYAGQGLFAKSHAVQQFNQRSALEERDHLLWTAQRLRELNAKPSLLNPLWYCGAWAMGAVVGTLGDKTSLAFVRETEAQVEAHLHHHESQLPAHDAASLAIVAQMKADEAHHAAQAQDLGANPLPAGIRGAMRLSAKLMTGTAYYI